MKQTVNLLDSNGSRRHESGPALLIVGHGSRDPRGAREFHDLVGLVRRTKPVPDGRGRLYRALQAPDLRVRGPAGGERGARTSPPSL